MRGKAGPCDCGPEHLVTSHCGGTRLSDGCPSPRDLCHRAYYCAACERQWEATCSPQCPKGS